MSHFSLPESTLRRRKSVKWAYYPEDVLPLWVAEMDVEMHPAVQDVLARAMRDSDTGYPAGDQYELAFTDLAASLWNWDIDPEKQLRRGGDVMNGILAVLLAHTKVGDKVTINTPIYPPFRQVISGYGRVIVESPLVNDRLDLAGLAQIFAEQRPTAYLLCSPHNPNGTVHTPAELTQVAALAAENNVLVVVDEIHGPIVHPESRFTPYLSVPGSERGVSVTSAGKAWNLAAFKAGIIACGTELANTFWAQLPPLAIQSAGHWATLAHTAALTKARDWLAEVNVEVAAHKQFLDQLLREHLPETRYVPSTGTYLAWVDCSAYKLAHAGNHFLEHAKVAFGLGTDYDPNASDWIRINLATNPEIIEEAIKRAKGSL